MIKKYKFFVFISLLCVVTGCKSTTQASVSGEMDSLEEIEAPILMFDDWQYKGFGKEYPLWAEAALQEDEKSLELYFPQITQNQMVVDVQKSTGTNNDMCKRKLENSEYSEEEAWLLEETWVRINSDYQVLQEPYVYIKLFLKNNIE